VDRIGYYGLLVHLLYARARSACVLDGTGSRSLGKGSAAQRGQRAAELGVDALHKGDVTAHTLALGKEALLHEGLQAPHSLLKALQAKDDVARAVLHYFRSPSDP
jgi:hypothetical protein